MQKILEYCCIGDSITNGARNEFYRNFSLELNYIYRNKPIFFKNYSINGETTSEILKRTFNLLNKNRNFDGIIFLGGTNDTKVPITKNIYKKNIQSIIGICKKLEINLFLGLLPRIYDGLPYYSQIEGNKYIEIYNNIIFSESKKNGIPCFNLFDLPKNVLEDGIHTNNKGCEMIAKKISILIDKYAL